MDFCCGTADSVAQAMPGASKFRRRWSVRPRTTLDLSRWVEHGKIRHADVELGLSRVQAPKACYPADEILKLLFDIVASRRSAFSRLLTLFIHAR